MNQQIKPLLRHSKEITDTMQPQDISIEVLSEKYAKKDEKSILDVRKRIAKALSKVEKNPETWEPIFLNNLENGFVAAGRISSAAGMDLHATLINCFVQPVGDCITGVDDDGYPSIYTALAEAAETMRRGGGVGYDFSRIRPFGALVKGTQSRASGPLSYMRVFDRSCETVESAGSRRGAQMGVLRCDHPDIFDFIIAKSKKGEFNNFNLSIGVTDAFMKAVENKSNWELVHKVKPGEEYIIKNNSYYDETRKLWVWKIIPVMELWDIVMKSTYNHAEPGILFIDQMNKENNLYYCETIEATNPCAEQPLPPYGCCDLGSVNLTMFVRNAFTDEAFFDYNTYKQAIGYSVRMLDNVLDATEWPLDKQYKEAMNKRRIGLGFLGIGDAIMMLNKRYNAEDGVKFAEEISEVLRNTAYETSISLAIEKGPFPLFDADKYLNSKYALRLPEEIREGIRKHGIRNSHLLSIAPTGTITLAFADNASNGIEPPFSWVYSRKKRSDDGTMKEYEVADHAWRLYRAMGGDVNNLPDNFITALQMSVASHVDIMKAVQPYIDTSISKTVNIPADYPYEDFKNLYILAWKSGLKGLATYRPNDTLGSILSEIKPETKTTVSEPVNTETPEEIFNAFMTLDHAKRPNGRLNGCSDKYEYFNSEGDVKFYVGASFIEKDIALADGSIINVRRPIELFINSEMNIGNEWSKLLGITLSQIARTSIYKLADYLKTCQKMRGDRGSIRFGYITKANGGKSPRYHGSDIAVMGYAIQELLQTEGILDKQGNPVQFSKLLCTEESAVINYVNEEALNDNNTEAIVATGAICTECGAPSVIKVDGCKKCTSCGWLGSCG